MVAKPKVPVIPSAERCDGKLTPLRKLRSNEATYKRSVNYDAFHGLYARALMEDHLPIAFA